MTCESGYPYLVSILADSFDVRGASEFFAPSWPHLRVHQLGEMMMRLTGGMGGEGSVGRFHSLFTRPSIASEKEKKKASVSCV